MSLRPSVSRMITFGVGARVIGVDGGGDAAHVDGEMGLAETAVFAGRAPRRRSATVSQKACTDTRGAGAI